MPVIEQMQKAIRELGLDGWLFCNFAHRDKLTDTLLALEPAQVATRRWFYLLRASGGTSLKIVHGIESDGLDRLEGDTLCYSGKSDLIDSLRNLAGLRVAVLCDPDIQVLSTMDASSLQLIQSCGIVTVSAAALIQRTKGLLDQNGIATHEKAAGILYRIVSDSWRLVRTAFHTGQPVYESTIQSFMLQQIAAAGMITDHPPIVAAGPNSGNPHYSIPTDVAVDNRAGRRLEAGDVVQFDLWATFPGGIYADISWIGYCGTAVPPEIQYRFETVIAARDLVKPAIEIAFARGQPITGAALDVLVRSFLRDRVPAEALRHRTGHGIDTDCHGSGVNLDSVEFPDHRLVLEGSCFSVEPGIYFPDAGFRTEINLYIHHGKPVLSGSERQLAILTL